MSYVFQRLAGQVFEPSNLILLVLCAASIAYAIKATLAARNIIVAAIIMLALISWTPLAFLLMRPLEIRFPPANLPNNVYGIIVLGGAFDMSHSLERPGVPALNYRADRMIAFVKLAKQYPSAKLIFSGGSADLSDSSVSEATLAKELFRELGLNDRRVTYEAASRNTRENALFSRRLVNLGANQLWLLVTSAADMPRAVGSFRAIGWNITPVPVDYHTRTKPGIPGLVDGFQMIDWATHEWLGLLYYWCKGWTTSLFPAPTQ